MKNLRKEGFTLIELIAVLVIMAILALIVTPLVMNIIRKARVAADKRSIDAYGRSIELAIASYLLDTGKFPTEVSQLTIEYSGDTVSFITEQINPDSSVYLAGCKVKNRNVEGYSYGTDKQPKVYRVGDEVTYNGVDYYVIENSDATESIVKLLKAEPLTVDEVNLYGGVGTSNNHVNMYVDSDTSISYYQTARNINGYGGMAYYSSEGCRTSAYKDGCTTDYLHSDIKYVVDAWKESNASDAVEARLITKTEIDENFEFEEFEYKPCGPCGIFIGQRIKEDWEKSYPYWTISQGNEFGTVWYVSASGGVGTCYVFDIHLYNTVRPVIVLDKSVLSN